jgi:orotidine-5'-phosphate decarboxylase
MRTFNQRLQNQIKQQRSHLCVGLDIKPEALMKNNASLDDLLDHTKKVISATHDLVAAYKPNLAFFERWGSQGYKWLESTIDIIGSDTLIIGDAKRGDIGSSAEQYALSLFNHFNFDAVTVNPYLGRDGIMPFLQHQGKGIFILCKTSNSSAYEIQDVKDSTGPVYIKVVQLVMDLSIEDNVGLVIGATVPEEIKIVRDLTPNIPFLIPGIGTQGGDFERSLKFGCQNGPVLISVSRSVIYSGDQSEKAIRDTAKNYVDRMRIILDE